MSEAEDRLVEALAVEIRNIFVCSLREEGISNKKAGAAADRFFSKLHYMLDQISDYDPGDYWTDWEI